MGKSKKNHKKKQKIERSSGISMGAYSVYRGSENQNSASSSGPMWYSQVQGYPPHRNGIRSKTVMLGKEDKGVKQEETITPPEVPDIQQEDEEQQEMYPSTEQQKQIMQMGSITTAKGKHMIHCLTVIGQIEGHYILPPQNKTTKYEHVIPQLVAIEEDPAIEGLLILLNTVGGDIEAGLAIAELIAGMKKPTVSLVLGGGHSIGVPLAVSAKCSFIAPSATMTVHPVRMNGLVLGVPQAFSYFDKMQDRITRFITDNSHIDPKRFYDLMMTTGELVTDVGTVLDGEQAVAEGLIDQLGSLSDAMNCLYQMIEQGGEQ